MNSLPKLEDTYGDRFFRKRDSLLWRASMFCPPVLDVLKQIAPLSHPRSLIDVGCAIGDFVQWFCKHKIDAYGLEGSTAVMPYVVCPPERMFYGDLRHVLPINRRYDLAMSIEVAEHVEPDYAENYVGNLVNLSDNLLLTIAGPGQKGHSHVNLQPPEYWEKLFDFHDYVRVPAIEKQLKERLHAYPNRWTQAIQKNLVFYRHNIVL